MDGNYQISIRPDANITEEDCRLRRSVTAQPKTEATTF